MIDQHKLGGPQLIDVPWNTGAVRQIDSHRE